MLSCNLGQDSGGVMRGHGTVRHTHGLPIGDGIDVARVAVGTPESGTCACWACCVLGVICTDTAHTAARVMGARVRATTQRATPGAYRATHPPPGSATAATRSREEQRTAQRRGSARFGVVHAVWRKRLVCSHAHACTAHMHVPELTHEPTMKTCLHSFATTIKCMVGDQQRQREEAAVDRGAEPLRRHPRCGCVMHGVECMWCGG